MAHTAHPWADIGYTFTLYAGSFVSGNKAEVGSEIISARLYSAGYQAKLLVSGTKVRLHREFLHS